MCASYKLGAFTRAYNKCNRLYKVKEKMMNNISKIYVIQNKIMHQNRELLLLGHNSNCKINEVKDNRFIVLFKFYCKTKQYYGVINNNFKIYIRKSPLSIKRLIGDNNIFFKDEGKK